MGLEPKKKKLKEFLAKEASSDRLFDFTQYSEYLADIYQRIKNLPIYPSYSYLQFAEDLGFPKTNALWLVITVAESYRPKQAADPKSHPF